MKTITITRMKDIQDGTLGDLVVSENGVSLFECKTLEPSGADETRRNLDRRIPKGRYAVMYYPSPKFKTIVPLIFNGLVPKDRYILIHWGNYPDDTDGCILVGASYNDKGVLNSRVTFKRLMEALENKEAELIID